MPHVRPEDLPVDFGRLPPDPRDERIAELESALDELHGAAYPMSTASNGTVQTMCVPIAAWGNAMRQIKTA